MIIKNHPEVNQGDFFVYLKKVLSFSNLRSGRTFRGLAEFESDSVTFSQFAEVDSFQARSVEKQIFAAVGRSDETKVSVSQFFDGSLHVNVKIKFVN